MNIPFVENRGGVDIDDDEDENETEIEYKEEKHAEVEKEDEVLGEENTRYDSVLPKGNISVITVESDPEMTKGNAKISEVKKIKQFYATEGEEVVMIKSEDERQLEYVRLVKLVELCLFVSLAIIFFSFICMICLFLL